MYSTEWTTVTEGSFDGFAWRADAKPAQLDDIGTLVIDYGENREAIEDISVSWYATLRAAVENCSNKEVEALVTATTNQNESITAVANRVERRLQQENIGTPAVRIVALTQEYGSPLPQGREVVAAGAVAVVKRHRRRVRAHNAISSVVGEVTASRNAIQNVYNTITSVVPPRLLTVTAVRATVPAGSATTSVSLDAAIE